jgi:hypothetical protein
MNRQRHDSRLLDAGAGTPSNATPQSRRQVERCGPLELLDGGAGRQCLNDLGLEPV